MKYEWILKHREEKLKLWSNMKYGMFIHYGLYSLCGGMWDGKKVEYGYSEQILSHGDVPYCDYERLQEQFTSQNFDADKIAKLAVKSGMKYIVITTKHHDGFCLWDTATTSYKSKKDIVRELSIACKNNGLKLGLYYSWIDWHYPFALPLSDHNSDLITERHMEYNLAQLTELLSNYGEISELWMDMGHPTYEQSVMVRKLALKLQEDILINGRIWNDQCDFLTMGDNHYPDYDIDLPWQTAATIFGETWGYRSWQKRDCLEEKINEVFGNYKRVIENGGNFLLNIGPMGDGTVVPFEEEVLLGVKKLIDKEGVDRKGDLSKAIVVDKDEFELKDGRKLCRYTGSDYYSYHPLFIGCKYKLDLPEDGVYSFSVDFDNPLSKEVKLALETNDDTLIFNLKKNSKLSLISSALELKKGINNISISSSGVMMEKSEFTLFDIRLKFKRK